MGKAKKKKRKQWQKSQKKSGHKQKRPRRKIFKDIKIISWKESITKEKEGFCFKAKKVSVNLRRRIEIGGKSKLKEILRNNYSKYRFFLLNQRALPCWKVILIVLLSLSQAEYLLLVPLMVFLKHCYDSLPLDAVCFMKTCLRHQTTEPHQLSGVVPSVIQTDYWGLNMQVLKQLASFFLQF